MGVEGRNTIHFKVNLWKVNGLLNSGCADDESWVQTSFEVGAGFEYWAKGGGIPEPSFTFLTLRS